MSTSLLVLLAILASAAAAFTRADGQATQAATAAGEATARIVAAATAFVTTLDAAGRAKVQFPFDSLQKSKWYRNALRDDSPASMSCWLLMAAASLTVVAMRSRTTRDTVGASMFTVLTFTRPALRLGVASPRSGHATTTSIIGTTGAGRSCG